MLEVSGAMPGSAFPPSEDWKETRNYYMSCQHNRGEEKFRLWHELPQVRFSHWYTRWGQLLQQAWPQHLSIHTLLLLSNRLAWTSLIHRIVFPWCQSGLLMLLWGTVRWQQSIYNILQMKKMQCHLLTQRHPNVVRIVGDLIGAKACETTKKKASGEGGDAACEKRQTAFQHPAFDTHTTRDRP